MTTRDRRALLWGSTLIAIAVLGVRGIPAGVRAYQHLRAERDQYLMTLARGQEIVARVEETRGALGQAAAALVAIAPNLLGGTTEGEAAGALSAAVSLAAARSNLRLVSANQQPVHSAVPGLFVPVRLRVQLEGDVTALASFLAEVESGAQVLSVDELSVERIDLTQGSNVGERLRVTLTITGWRLQRDAA